MSYVSNNGVGSQVIMKPSRGGCPSLIKYLKVLNLAQWISLLTLLLLYLNRIVWISWMGSCMAKCHLMNKFMYIGIKNHGSVGTKLSPLG